MQNGKDFEVFLTISCISQFSSLKVMPPKLLTSRWRNVVNIKMYLLIIWHENL